MTDPAPRLVLLARLVSSYADLKQRLARRLGSVDRAAEVLHETYLRLQRIDVAAPVTNPDAYLMRTVLNVAADRRRDEDRFISTVELGELWDLADDGVDPEAAAVARGETVLFKQALRELSPRCRAILLAARVEELPHQEIAARFGISTRMVQFELRRALEHCASRLERKLVRRFGPNPKERS